MLRNEKGFVLPFVLMLALLVIFVIQQQLQVYVYESRFAKQVRHYYELEHLLESALVDAASIFTEAGEVGAKKVYMYPQGEVTYTLQSWQNGRMMIEIHCSLLSKFQTKGLAEIEAQSGLIIKWKKL